MPIARGYKSPRNGFRRAERKTYGWTELVDLVMEEFRRVRGVFGREAKRQWRSMI
jgi:hypothetical protein